MKILTVAGFPAYTISEDATIFNPWGKILQHDTSSRGYHRIRLQRGSQQIMCMVSRLMLETFVGPPPSPKHHAAHQDDNIDNNHIDNLKWQTPGENGRDKVVRGRSAKGARHGRAKIDDRTAREIIAKAARGVPLATIAREHELGWTTVSHIVKGDTWKHIR
jgi:hypothetical protein